MTLGLCRSGFITLLVALATGLLGGCGGSGEAPNNQVDTSRSNLLAIHTAYTEFITAERVPPRSRKDLEKTQPEMDRLQLDALFTSPHDDQPYVIAWGLKVGTGQPAPPVVLAHEKDGKDGKRFVLFTDGRCEHMTQEEFDSAPRPAR